MRMIETPIYEAGGDQTQRHSVSLNLHRAGLPASKAAMIARFIEFWCQENCSGVWRVEETTRDMVISFDQTRDVVLFRISEYQEIFRTAAINTAPDLVN